MLSPALLGEKASPLTPKQLLDLPLIPDTRWMRWFALAGLPDAVPTFASTRFATYELEAIAAAKGVGVALLSPFLYGDLVAQRALVAPFATIVEGPQSYFALWREGATAPHFVRWIRKELDEARVAQNP
jgi:LysR family glycine cleavage system transcriptional activator